jgi:hypothetical protein
MSNVIRTFIAIPQNVREWVMFFETLFFSNTFVASLSGCVAIPTGTIRYSVSAGLVVLDVPQIQGTSNSTAATLSTLPIQLRPASDKTAIARVIDNGTAAFGLFVIATTGVITLSPVPSGSPLFTAAGTKGVKACSIVYEID